MDVLSDVICAMRVGRPHSARIVRRAPFGRYLPAVAGAGFHVMLQGSAWLLPETGDPIALTTGDAVFLPHGTAHGLADHPSRSLERAAPEPLAEVSAADTLSENETSATAVMLCGAYLLDRSRPHPLLQELPDVMHLRAQVGRHPQLRAALELLGHELSKPAQGGEMAITALLDLLLLYILRSWHADRRHGSGGTDWAAALRDPPVSRALREIHSQPGVAWSVEELAATAALSRSAFSRRFTTLVGRPPLAYLTWWRMTLAARLLSTCDLPLSVVAEQLGFASEYSFAHAFKREHGQAPGAYRRTRRASAATDAIADFAPSVESSKQSDHQDNRPTSAA